MNNDKKHATITIRTTENEKEQLQQIADNERRPLAQLLYIWVIDRLHQEKENQ